MFYSWAMQTILIPTRNHLENSGQFQLPGQFYRTTWTILKLAACFSNYLDRCQSHVLTGSGQLSRDFCCTRKKRSCYPGFFRLWLTANSEWSEFLSLSKWSVCWKVISAIRGNTPTDWAFWDWLYRTVMSPKAELAVQLCLFPYFHLRNNEIFSLLCGTTLL